MLRRTKLLRFMADSWKEVLERCPSILAKKKSQTNIGYRTASGSERDEDSTLILWRCHWDRWRACASDGLDLCPARYCSRFGNQSANGTVH